MTVFFAYLMVTVLGALVGFSELITRYRDEPMRLAGYVATIVYCSINAAAAILALGVVRALDVTLGFDAKENVVYWLQILAAGTSAMVLLRTSVAKVRVHGVDVAIGPQAFLDALQAAADRQVDRRRAKERDSVVAPLMEDVAFDAASKVLPPYCFQLLQNAAPGEEAAVAAEVLKYRELDLPDSVKSRLLGLMLLSVVGKDVLEQAVTSLTLLLQPPQPLTPKGQVAAQKLEAYFRHGAGASSATASEGDPEGDEPKGDAGSQVPDGEPKPEEPTGGMGAGKPELKSELEEPVQPEPAKVDDTLTSTAVGTNGAPNAEGVQRTERAEGPERATSASEAAAVDPARADGAPATGDGPAHPKPTATTPPTPPPTTPPAAPSVSPSATPPGAPTAPPNSTSQ